MNQNYQTTSAGVDKKHQLFFSLFLKFSSLGRAVAALNATFWATRNATEERLTNTVYRPLANEAIMADAVLSNILDQQEELVQRILQINRSRRMLSF